MYLSLNSPAFLLVSTDKQINFSEPPADAPNFNIGDSVDFHIRGEELPGPYHPDALRAHQRRGAHDRLGARRRSPYPTGPWERSRTSSRSATGPQIPLSALQSRADYNFVFAIVNGKAAEVRVIIVAEAGTTAVVRGLNAGDQVILNPPPGLLQWLDRASRDESDSAGPGCGQPAGPGRSQSAEPEVGAGGRWRKHDRDRQDNRGRNPMKSLRDLETTVFNRVNPAVNFSVRRYVLADRHLPRDRRVRNRIDARPRGRPASRREHPGCRGDHILPGRDPDRHGSAGDAADRKPPLLRERHHRHQLDELHRHQPGDRQLRRQHGQERGGQPGGIARGGAGAEAPDGDQPPDGPDLRPQLPAHHPIRRFRRRRGPRGRVGLRDQHDDPGPGARAGRREHHLEWRADAPVPGPPGSEQAAVLQHRPSARSWPRSPSQAINTPIGTIESKDSALTFSTQNTPADITAVARIMVDPARGIAVDDIGSVRDVPVATRLRAGEREAAGSRLHPADDGFELGRRGRRGARAC